MSDSPAFPVRRVLFVTPMYPSPDDAIQGLFVRELAEALDAEGVDVRVAHVRHDLFWPLSMLKRRRSVAGDPGEGGAVPVLRHAVRGWPAAFGVARYARGLAAGLPEAIAREWPDFRPDVVHAHTIVPGWMAAKSVAARFGCPLVATIHGADVRLWLRRARSRRAVLDACRSGSPIFCVGGPLKQALVDAGADPDSLRVIPNGMDWAKVHSGPNPLAPRHVGKQVVLGVGNLVASKGFDVFIEAIAEVRKTFPDAYGLIVGDGPERRRLEHLVRKRNAADAVEFAGAQTPAETMRRMDRCDLFCLPSWFEGFGVSYLEAMAHGKPVVAVEGQGIAPIVREAGAGLLVPPKDVSATAAAIQRLLGNPRERREMGERGRQAVRERFSWARCARETIGTYAEAVRSTAAVRVGHVDFALDESVERKLERLAHAARQLGLPIDVVVFSLHRPPGRTGNLIVHRLPGSWMGRRFAAKVQWPFRLAWAARVLEKEGYDAIVLRYPKLPLGGRGFVRRIGVPVITEHHSDEVAELRGSGSPVRRLAAALEARLRSGFLRQVAGVVGVTPEIAERIRREAPQAEAIAISNGVDVESVPFTGSAPFDGSLLRLVSVAAHFADWHGLDRLLDGILAYAGSCRIELVLLGHVPDVLRPRLAACARKAGIAMRETGPVYGEAASPWYSAAHLAVASLGLHRQGLRQASPLKTREYVARGIPFAYGYDDPDLPDPCEFAMQVSADESPVDPEALVRFAARTAGRADLSAKMREFARERLDWKRKAREMHDFARRAVAAGERSGPAVGCRNERRTT